MSQPMGQPAYGDPVPSNSDSRGLALVAHLSGLVAAVTAGWLGWVVPLVLFLMYKDKDPFVRRASAESLNFQISLVLIAVISTALFFTVILIPLAIIGFAVAMIAAVIFPILAALAANRGEAYRYPLTWHILS